MQRTVRAAVAGVWLYQGAWKKGPWPDERHREIIASVPGVTAVAARRLTAALGVIETGLAGWVLTGWRPRRAAAAQTALVIVMNAGGLLFAGDLIAGHRRMMARNAVLLAAAWVIA